jgi:hypothetical protein
MCQHRKRFSQNSGGRQGRHAPPAGLQEGDGKCVLCLTYPLPERRFPLEARRTSPSLVSNSTSPDSQRISNRCGGLCHLTHSRGTWQMLHHEVGKLSERRSGGLSSKIFRGWKAISKSSNVSFAARVSENSKTHHAIVAMPSIVDFRHGHLLWWITGPLGTCEYDRFDLLTSALPNRAIKYGGLVRAPQGDGLPSSRC